MSLLQACNASGELDHRHLHAKAEAKIGNLLLPSILYSGNFTFDSALTKSARDKDTVHSFKKSLCSLFFDLLRIYFDEIHTGIFAGGGMEKGFSNAFVGIGHAEVFSDHGHLRSIFRGNHPAD